MLNVFLHLQSLGFEGCESVRVATTLPKIQNSNALGALEALLRQGTGTGTFHLATSAAAGLAAMLILLRGWRDEFLERRSLRLCGGLRGNACD